LNDLNQYPVFPWILSDYTSETLDLSNPSVYRDLTKPIAAYDQQRLNEIVYNYKSMNGPFQKCLFQTHYSNSASVIGF
jgi:hypothetical protein